MNKFYTVWSVYASKYIHSNRKYTRIVVWLSTNDFSACNSTLNCHLSMNRERENEWTTTHTHTNTHAQWESTASDKRNQLYLCLFIYLFMSIDTIEMLMRSYTTLKLNEKKDTYVDACVSIESITLSRYLFWTGKNHWTAHAADDWHVMTITPIQ